MADDGSTIYNINRPKVDGGKGAMLPTAGNTKLIPAFSKHIDVDHVDAYLASIRSIAGEIGNGLTEAVKALGAIPPQAFSYSTMAFMPDPANYGLMQWPGINPESLSKVARENVAPLVIIRQRCDDISRYSEYSTHTWRAGWRIVMRDASEAPTEDDYKAMKEVAKFMMNCSMDGDRDPRERDKSLISPLDTFLRGFVNDTLTYDGWAIWTDMDSAGRVRRFANLPAGMIRLTVPHKGLAGNRDIFAALVDETGSPVKPFNRNELTWRVRNVRNDPFVCGYGWPEIEMAVRLIQAFTGAIELNAGTFTNSSIPNGMMLLKGDYFNQDQIDALMREWTNMKRGLSKLWGMPVMSVPEDSEVEILNFMDLKGEEVRYRDHMNMMMGLCCLMWRYPISRLGMFVSGHTKDSAPTQDAAIEIQGADDPGLPPLLSFVEQTFNPYLIWPRWPKYKFEFTSKNPKEDARGYEARKLARTWGEARKEADLPDLETLVDEDLKPLAKIMSLAPEDTVKAGVFQTVASMMMEASLGLNDPAGEGGGEGGKGNGGSRPNAGSPIMPKKDPAESQGHGHLSGTRRNSRAERDRAALSSKNS